MKGLGGWIGGGREAWYRCPGGGCAARLPRGTRHAHARGRPPRPWGRMRRRRHANPTLPNRGSIGRCAMGGSRKRRRRRRRRSGEGRQKGGATGRNGACLLKQQAREKPLAHCASPLYLQGGKTGLLCKNGFLKADLPSKNRPF
ncbi:unnamed protein product [Prorocentrum cordatum]|uniref:Uncharacterized protein n=1 Tax=Prorocentrum cordatum TaxID=2364126 RepID=A0ABN9UFW5_9DINO|nr:unnamed protein product [Polarella glacialis]